MPEEMALWRAICDAYGLPPMSGGDDGDAGADRDTPVTPESGPAEDTRTEDVDWAKRYNDLRPEYDRTTGELSQYRDFFASLSDPSTQAEALAALGLQLETDDYEDEYDENDDEDADTEELLARRLAGIEAYLAADQQAAEDAALEAETEMLEHNYIEQQLEGLESEIGKLPDGLANAIGNLAYAYPDEDGLPDVATAYVVWADATAAQQQAYLDSKQSWQLAQGTEGVDHVNLNDADARANAAAHIIEAVQNMPDEG